MSDLASEIAAAVRQQALNTAQNATVDAAAQRFQRREDQALEQHKFGVEGPGGEISSFQDRPAQTTAED